MGDDGASDDGAMHSVKNRSHPHEVLPGVFLGDFEDALTWNGPILTVHEAIGRVARWAYWIPILYGPFEAPKASRLMLDAGACIIRHHQRAGMRILVHCAAGIERSPLLVAWFMKKYRYARTMDEAYAAIQKIRPQVQNRTIWLESRDR